MDNLNDNQERITRTMSEVKPEKLEWLWYPFAPLNKLTVLFGNGGIGKSTLLLNLASILSRGGTLPFSSQKHDPMDIIYQTIEDDYEDTIYPRLLAANADFDRIHHIIEDKKALTMTDERLEQAIIIHKPRLVILDPLQSYLAYSSGSSAVNMNMASAVRPILNNLVHLAKKYKLAIILVGHMTKGGEGEAFTRLLGSVDIISLCRSGLVVGTVDEKKGIRGLGHAKSNLAEKGKVVGFKISKNYGFEWTGLIDMDVSELLYGSAKSTKLNTAEDFLEDVLRNGEIKQVEIFEKATSEGIKERTLRQAKKNIGVESKKIGDSWYWKLPE